MSLLHLSFFALVMLLGVFGGVHAAASKSPAFILSKLRAEHAQMREPVNVSAIETSSTEELVVKHKAIPDPAAYDKLEQRVVEMKTAKKNQIEQTRRIFHERASLRKGGLNEVQEFLPNLPAGNGPLGRIYKPIFGANTLVEDETVTSLTV